VVSTTVRAEGVKATSKEMGAWCSHAFPRVRWPGFKTIE
jgi:hypothetical protein